MKEKCCKNCRRHDDFTWVCFNGNDTLVDRYANLRKNKGMC